MSFLAPFLLWIGAALLAWRVARWALSKRRALAKATRPFAHGLSGAVAASMSRQYRLLARGLTLVTLTAAFAVSTSVFNATFAAQARVEYPPRSSDAVNRLRTCGSSSTISTHFRKSRIAV